MSKRAAEATYTLRFPTVNGRVAMQVQVPRGPMRLRDLVPIAQRVSQHHVDRALVLEKKEGREVSCRRGCVACCRQIVPISAPEAFRLADHVLALGGKRRDRILARIDATESAIQAAGLLEELEALAADTHDDPRSLAARYFDHHIACPFLVDEESCGVYVDRPLVCRHYAVTTPASWCSSPTLHQIRIVPMPQPLSRTLSEATAALTGEPPAMIPLSTAMRWVDAHADVGFLEWPGMEVMGALLRALGIPEAEIAACGS
jgi:Fe-S-cluster containining protein